MSWQSLPGCGAADRALTAGVQGGGDSAPRGLVDASQGVSVPTQHRGTQDSPRDWV